ncbi:MAG TPA: prepilin-type N-terminal cleavage/methylation domain-containing protein [Candidatus Elarobacter sp.]|nr:prepilin-type N-terminal cleavage/methylation domain-containing protein [Candidatus Elarobacter sp.]
MAEPRERGRITERGRRAERGFTLIELVLCVGMLAMASAATLGVFAALARNATPGPMRDAALNAGENALVRARAAVAYASSPTQDGTALIGDRSWALVPGRSEYVAGAEMRSTAPCGDVAPRLVRMPVAVTYDAPNERLTVVVTYPRNPCAVAADGSIAGANAATVTLAETLPPSVYPPAQVVHHDVATPSRM